MIFFCESRFGILHAFMYDLNDMNGFDKFTYLSVAQSEELSEEDKQKKEVRERMRQEFYFAIQEEGM